LSIFRMGIHRLSTIAVEKLISEAFFS